MYIIALIVFILLAILFNKVGQLKKMINYQDLKIKHLQEELDKYGKPVSQKTDYIRPEIVQPKTTPPIVKEQPISEPIKPQPIPINQPKPAQKPIEQPKIIEESLLDKTINGAIAFIKDNFLTVIGIVTLVLGIAYFVKYAIDQNWINETFRVIIGIIIGFAIIGTAHKIRKNYAIFSSILIGGGLTILYFTLTIAFREYQLLSVNTTFALLTLVTIFSIVLAMLYNRQVLAIFSIVGGFTAPLMISTGESNFVFLFSYLALLNLSMLYMSWRKNWQIISLIAFVFTSIYSFGWIDTEKTQNQNLFFILLYLIFAATSLLNYFKRLEFSVPNCILFITNTIVFSSLISLATYYFIEKYPGLIPLIFGLINALFAYYVYQTSKNNLLLNTLIGLSVVLITTAIGLEYDANVVSICFALESTLLLFLWKKSGNAIFKVFFILMFPFLFCFLCVNWIEYFETTIRLPIIFNHIFITSFIVLVCSVFNIYLMKDFETDEQFLGFKIAHSKFIFTSTSILLMYVGILLEIIYQIEPYFSLALIISYVIIYTLFFIALLLSFREKLNLADQIIFALQISAATCIIILPMIADIPNEAYRENFRISSYFIYLSYLFPTAYLFYLVFKQPDFKTSTVLQITTMLLLVYLISFEKYNSFMLITIDAKQDNFGHQQDIFQMILLPIIWAVLGFVLIYIGFKKHYKYFPIVGFILFGLIILKLYLIDVWQMSNVFRIVSFIILGLLILITSFMYQKLKNLMKNLIDKSEE